MAGSGSWLRKAVGIVVAVVGITSAGLADAAGTNLTIIHTNDLHSHLLGHSPNIDYTPATVGDDKTVGGWARLATVIKETRRDRENPVVVLDAGDFMMGSLFHMPSREDAFELRLLGMMGYDVVTLGNHEFDLMPGGLARILTMAVVHGPTPAIVSSNVEFSPDSDRDDTLEALFKQGGVRPYRVVEKDGIRIGLFGLMGLDAAEVAPFAKPVRFSDPLAAARKMVGQLRDKENVDLVIALSHSGLSKKADKSEDVILAREVKGIDVIISGHTHTVVEKPIRVGDTLIVQAGAYSQHVGIMDLELKDGRVGLKDYRLKAIDDRIPGDPEITAEIETFERIVNDKVLGEKGLEFRGVIAHTDFDLRIGEEESNLGNLIADAIRWRINQMDYDPKDPATEVKLGVMSNGLIRDDILQGRTGNVAVCDVFRAVPLGIGMDDTMGYPLVSFYLYGSEIKKAFEILTTIYPLKHADYYLQFSGARVAYNPNRMLFDRVTGVWIGDEEKGYVPLDVSKSNKQLYRVGADIYNSTFLKIIGDFTSNILVIVPKDRDGRPIADLKAARIDRDKNREGLQELKEWVAVMEYIRSFKDGDGDGLPDFPEKYKTHLGRQVVEASWNPYHLLKGGNYLTWTVFAVVAVGLLVVFLLGRFTWRRLKRR